MIVTIASCLSCKQGMQVTFLKHLFQVLLILGIVEMYALINQALIFQKVFAICIASLLSELTNVQILLLTKCMIL